MNTYLLTILWILSNWPMQNCTDFIVTYAKFEDPTFDNLYFIETLTSATYPMSWFSNLNGEVDVEYVIFSFVWGKYPFYHFVVGVRGLQPITKATFQQSINKVKEECEG